MKRIPIGGQLGVRGYAIVDDEDAEWAASHRWHFLGVSAAAPGYAARSVSGTNKQVYMHREILERMGHVDFQQGDHIDRNPLNNSRSNLRPATPKLNANNRNTENMGRKRSLPDAEPRPCRSCATVFTPRRKSPGRVYCSVACQRRSVLAHDSESQGRRAQARWNGGAK